MENMNFAKDLHRKGELNKLDVMEATANKYLKGKDMCHAFVTEGWLGFDAFCIIANSSEYSDKEGAILFDEDTQKAFFMPEPKDN